MQAKLITIKHMHYGEYSHRREKSDLKLAEQKVSEPVKIIISLIASGYFLYHIPAVESLSSFNNRPKISTFPDAACFVEEMSYSGASPVDTNFWQGHVGHSFIAFTKDGKTDTYGFYPKSYSNIGDDGVNLNNLNDLDLYSKKDTRQIFSNKIFVDCQDIPKLEQIIQNISQKMHTYRLNPNFPIVIKNFHTEEIQGNCVTFVKEFFKSIDFVDSKGKSIKHLLPMFDTPLAHSTIMQLNQFLTEINNGDLVTTTSELLGKLLSSILENIKPD